MHHSGELVEELKKVGITSAKLSSEPDKEKSNKKSEESVKK